jgi:hypothetical protein
MSQQTQAWPSAAKDHDGTIGACSWSDSQAASPSRCTCSTATAACPGLLPITEESRPAATAGLVLACTAPRCRHRRCLCVA